MLDELDKEVAVDDHGRWLRSAPMPSRIAEGTSILAQRHQILVTITKNSKRKQLLCVRCAHRQSEDHDCTPSALRESLSRRSCRINGSAPEEYSGTTYDAVVRVAPEIVRRVCPSGVG